MKIVESGYKVDLHIHSVASRSKDGAKVYYNTIEHIDTLIEKLNENQVHMCALTDHDVFDYEMYKKLKETEEDSQTSIIKVFPGIEFSVEFQGDKSAKTVHVIAIFNDEDDKKVQAISEKIIAKDGKIAYDRDMAFSEEKFLMILRNIDLDTVLIAHQKGSLSTKGKPSKNDARSVGDERFQEFIHTDYFEAFEFKNRKNEVFNKAFLEENHLTEDIRFITGSDCHDWREYPKVDSTDSAEFKYSYVKCLPGFRGLVMAITDHRRIKTVDSFFNPNATYTSKIELLINGQKYDVPLSRGINVIIGDNSIGKSLILHKLTGFQKREENLIKKALVDGYNAYLKKNKVQILTEILPEEIFAFDMQGEVRDKFERGKINSDDFLSKYYPAPVRGDVYKEKILHKLQGVYNFLEMKFSIAQQEVRLGKFRLMDDEGEQAESLSFIGVVQKNNSAVKGYDDVVCDVGTVIEKLNHIQEPVWLEEEDRNEIQDIIRRLSRIFVKYDQKKKIVEFENEKIGLFQTVINSFRQKYQTSTTDVQKRKTRFHEDMDDVVINISDLLLKKSNQIPIDIIIEKERIDVQTERVYDYEFNSRLNITEIGTDYLQDLFTRVLKKDNKKSVLDMTQSELASALPYFQENMGQALEELKNRIHQEVEKDFGNKYTITQAGMDRTEELSAGFNSKIYFDLLSYENRHPGVYIIDQPEDNISQKAIREYLLDRFKVMGENRQVILVTHNPQFIVNLDADNVIYLGRGKNGIFVQSGALEYKDQQYNILDIISTHIEGGLDTLKRRWKRYEKSSSI